MTDQPWCAPNEAARPRRLRRQWAEPFLSERGLQDANLSLEVTAPSINIAPKQQLTDSFHTVSEVLTGMKSVSGWGFFPFIPISVSWDIFKGLCFCD